MTRNVKDQSERAIFARHVRNTQPGNGREPRPVYEPSDIENRVAEKEARRTRSTLQSARRGGNIGFLDR